MCADLVPFVSVLVPCRNEEVHIEACLTSLLANDYPRAQVEILVMDGESTDRTREVVARVAGRDPRVQLIENPDRITSAALNLGLRQARGSVIILAGAHASYAPTHLRRLVSHLNASGADGVGGICETVPADGSAEARAIAAAMTHPFGVGNAWFRLGVEEPRYVDTVPFGAYPRAVFDRVGGFDEELIRNQDDEFNARVLRSGGRLLLVPDVRFTYVSRGSLSQLARMYFQYGLYKPLAARKVGAVVTTRQIIPSLFVLALAGSLLLALLLPRGVMAFALVAGAYLAAAVAVSASMVPKLGIAGALWIIVAFPVLHLSYGAGALLGALRLALGKRPAVAPAGAVPLSR
jgi:glycosyltransferase involved in cell wall biosynthesis